MVEAQASACPDPGSATDLGEFIALLDRLRVWGGDPSFRDLAKRVGALSRRPQQVSKSTVADLFQPGRRRLSQDLVVAVVRALGLDEPDVDRWRAACVRVHAQPRPRRVATRPAELSADLPDFTGRTAVAEQLTALLGPESSGPAVAVVLTAAISGSGGVGKTSLAVHVAHRVLRQFPDGQLQVDLNAAGGSAAAPQDVLARFLRALGTPAAEIAVDPDERGAQYRSLLAERRVLVLLDNVRDAAQVRPLLPGAGGSRVLITSRSAMVGLDGAVRVTLGVLDPAESLALFRRVVGAERSAAEPAAERAVLEACAGLPLAIRLAASRLVARPDWSVRDLADHLADETRRLNVLSVEDRAVRATFAVSYRDLSPHQARAFRLLALCPGPATSLPAAAALLALPPHEAAEHLEGLAAVHLIEQPSPGRFTMHDLVRLYAAERAHADEPADEREAATDRLLYWLLRTNDAASRLLRPDRRHLDLEPVGPDCRPQAFEGVDEARTWCATEADHLVAAVALAAESGRDEIAWKLAHTMWELFNTGEERDGIPTYERALASTRRLGDPEAVSWVLNALAPAYRRVHRMPESEACLLQAIEIRRSLGDLRGEASCLGNLGLTLTESGRAADAVPLLERCADIFRGLGVPSFEGAAHTNLGEAYKRLGNLDAALDHYRAALRLHREDDTFSVGREQSNIADALRRLDRWDEAAVHAGQAREANRRTGNRIDEAIALEVLGYADDAHGRVLDARRRWQQALAILRELNHPRATEVEALLRTVTAAGRRRTR
ncbi:tetratricopeptide (TPR) repeat protein [Streptacidiphilus sp. MAP12-33]|uniref:ATP-binding protein n=1 Tax=Streptacidiphilus sp. MAP12-33 TaxID=3156266 RepID=UPI003515BB7B